VLLLLELLLVLFYFWESARLAEICREKISQIGHGFPAMAAENSSNLKMVLFFFSQESKTNSECIIIIVIIMIMIIIIIISIILFLRKCSLSRIMPRETLP